MYLQIIFALALTTQSFAFYVSSAVTELDSDNFDRVVLQSDDVWIVQLYAKWSEDSRKAVEEFIKLANCLKYESFAFRCSHSHTDRNSSIYAGAINVNDSEEKFIESFNFTGVPVFKIYGQNKSAPIVYGGALSADEILAFVRDMVIINENETISDYGFGVEPEPQKYTTTEVTVETMNDENEYDYDDDYEVMTEFIPTSAAAATEMVDDVTEDVWKLEAWFPTNIEVEIADKETEDVDRMEATTEWTPTSAEAETGETEDVYESDNSTQSSEKTADETIDNESKNEYDDDYGIVTEWIPTSAAAATEIVYDENEKVYLNDPLLEWTPTSAEAETLDEETEDVYRSDTSTQSSKKIADEAMDDESKYEYDDDYEVVTEWTLTSAEAATEMFDEETEDVYGNDFVTEWTPMSTETETEILDEEAEDVYENDFVTEWTPTSAETETLDEDAEDVYGNDFVTEWTPTSAETETLDEETEDVHRNKTVTQLSKKTANETMLNAGGVQNKMFCSALASLIVAYFLTLRQ